MQNDNSQENFCDCMIVDYCSHVVLCKTEGITHLTKIHRKIYSQLNEKCENHKSFPTRKFCHTWYFLLGCMFMHMHQQSYKCSFITRKSFSRCKSVCAHAASYVSILYKSQVSMQGFQTHLVMCMHIRLRMQLGKHIWLHNQVSFISFHQKQPTQYLRPQQTPNTIVLLI